MKEIKWDENGEVGIYDYKGIPIEVRRCEVEPTAYTNLAIWALGHERYCFPNTAHIDVSRCGNWADLEDKIRARFGNTIWEKTVILYDHGLLAINYNDCFSSDPLGWDTSRIGCVFTTKERIKEFFGVNYITGDIMMLANIIYERDLDIFKCYIQGDAYDVYNPITDDSFTVYGRHNVYNAIEDEVEPLIDIYLKSLRKKALHTTKYYIQSRVPIIYRKPFGKRYSNLISKKIVNKEE